QAALTQPSSLSANVGDTVRITGTSSYSYSNYGCSQQKVPGTAPVTGIYYNYKRPSEFPLQFYGSKSDSTGTLTISGIQNEE
ncbi:LV1 protein, partial [Zosterops hypoxanthus]|nr:LV1 protein [Zosterops hypoxanthus]